jgi:hypothetical protein
MTWTPSGWGSESLLDEKVPSDDELAVVAPTADKLEKLKGMRDTLRGYAELVPAAFEPPTAEFAARVAAVGRNWVSSSAPLDTPVVMEGACMSTVSAGHEAHPSTTFAATTSVFAFLDARLSADD